MQEDAKATHFDAFSERSNVDEWCGLGRRAYVVVEPGVILTSCPARYDGIAEFLIPLDPRGSNWVGPAFKSQKFELAWSFRAKR